MSRGGGAAGAPPVLDALVHELLAARTERRALPPPSATHPLDAARAYAVQDRLREALVAGGERVVGRQQGRVVPAAEDGLADHLAQIVEVHDHVERVQRLGGHRDLEVIGVAVQVRALARVPADTVRSVKGVGGLKVHEFPGKC